MAMQSVPGPWNEPARAPPARPVDLAGGGGDDGGMNARIDRLEQAVAKVAEEVRAIDMRLLKIETRCDAFATKADVAEAKFGVVQWVAGTFIAGQILPVVLKALHLA